jgi:peptidoglycan/LPS O-acetylase OafA/YrhL
LYCVCQELAVMKVFDKMVLIDAFIVLFIITVIIYLGARSILYGTDREARLGKWLGDISYPLYITRSPFIYIYYAWVIIK